jgi:hypothetical protein
MLMYIHLLIYFYFYFIYNDTSTIIRMNLILVCAYCAKPGRIHLKEPQLLLILLEIINFLRKKRPVLTLYIGQLKS